MLVDGCCAGAFWLFCAFGFGAAEDGAAVGDGAALVLSAGVADGVALADSLAVSLGDALSSAVGDSLGDALGELSWAAVSLPVKVGEASGSDPLNWSIMPQPAIRAADATAAVAAATARVARVVTDVRNVRFVPMAEPYPAPSLRRAISLSFYDRFHRA